MEEKKTTETGRKIHIDPDILLDCSDYVTDTVNGYIAIYQSFQKILWTLQNRGVSPSDAASATIEIVNRAAAKAQASVPHKDPFTKLPTDEKDDENKEKEKTKNDDAAE